MKWLRFMDQRSYVHGELTDLYKIIELLNDTLSSQIGGKHHDALIGLYLSNIYMGVERLLRLKLKAQNIKIQKNEGWHKELLLRARSEHIVSEENYSALLDLLSFRHLYI